MGFIIKNQYNKKNFVVFYLFIEKKLRLKFDNLFPLKVYIMLTFVVAIGRIES